MRGAGLMLGCGQVIAGRQEFLGAGDPAAGDVNEAGRRVSGGEIERLHALGLVNEVTAPAASLAAALALADRLKVLVLAQGSLTGGSTAWAAGSSTGRSASPAPAIRV